MKPPISVAQMLLVVLVALLPGCANRARVASRSPEQRAIAFLARAVPAWSRENGCFSCHHNGDAARALYAAKHLGFAVPAAALADTTVWVSRPARWDHNKGDPGFSDKRLANLQFAASLLAAVATGQVTDATALRAAADRVAADQAADSAWPVEAQDTLGSPATFGTTLATFTAWQVLSAADAGQAQARPSAVRAGEWLRRAPMNNVPAAATLLRFALRDDFTNAPLRRMEAFTLLRRAQTSGGGWGPYPDHPAEVFDTAIALLALTELPREAAVDAMIQRGRAFLLSQQQADGSWAATTRPSGGESYAQQMSTTGWAAQALLASCGK